MLYYFSGTGNSRYAATHLARRIDDTATDLCAAPQPIPAADTLGLVCPVYAWGLPDVVSDFIAALPRTATPPTYVFALLTCGDDIGRSDRMLRRALARQGYPLHAVFSLQMPNTYIGLPGFDVDSHEVVARKLAAASARLAHIATAVAARQSVTDVVPGSMAWCKSHLLRPLFRQWLSGHRMLRVSPSRCTHCGTCQRRCPMGNVSLNDEGLPQFGTRCTFCLSCYHHCPAHAISVRPAGHHKGQQHLDKTPE